VELESVDRSVALHPVGYEFPGADPSGKGWNWDANWLQVRGEVRDGDLAWRFEDACMTTSEARELAAWLRSVASGGIGSHSRPDGSIRFIEPNVAFRLEARTSASVTITVSFAHASSPPGADDEIRLGAGHMVELTLTPEAVQQAADEWERELTPFPLR
jgi:hypothetical protein